MKVTIFHDIILVKSLAFVPFRSLAMYFLQFIISYGDERNFPVCYHSVLPLDNIGKYFAIVKQQVIFQISQILTTDAILIYPMPVTFYEASHKREITNEEKMSSVTVSHFNLSLPVLNFQLNELAYQQHYQKKHDTQKE